MTREEFRNLSGKDLIDLAFEYDLEDLTGSLIEEGEYDGYIYEEILEWQRFAYGSWKDLRNFLNEIPERSSTGYMWKDDNGNYIALNSDDDIKGFLYEDIYDFFESEELFDEEVAEAENVSALFFNGG